MILEGCFDLLYMGVLQELQLPHLKLFATDRIMPTYAVSTIASNEGFVSAIGGGMKDSSKNQQWWIKYKYITWYTVTVHYTTFDPFLCTEWPRLWEWTYLWYVYNCIYRYQRKVRMHQNVRKVHCLILLLQYLYVFKIVTFQVALWIASIYKQDNKCMCI